MGRGLGAGEGLACGCAQYRPPVFKKVTRSLPPQTIISLPVQTAVSESLPTGALVVLVAVQLSVLGLYLPPVFKKPPVPIPPQTIISLPVQVAVWRLLPSGALITLVVVHVSSVHGSIAGRV